MSGFQVLIDKDVTIPYSMESLARVLLPRSKLKQKLLVHMISMTWTKGNEGIHLKEIYDLVERRPKHPSGYSRSTISSVWVAMLQSGLIEKSGRGSPAHISYRFSSMLSSIQYFWANSVKDLKQAPKQPATEIRE